MHKLRTYSHKLITISDVSFHDCIAHQSHTALTEAGVEDMMAHFLPWKRLWGMERRTWSMVREGRVIRSQMDYLLGTDISPFRNVAV